MSSSLERKLVVTDIDIPTLPQVVAKINAMIDDPEMGTREIGRVVAEDAPISAKVLRIANSAYYGLRERVLSTEHATAVLGVRVLRNIAVQAAVIKQFEHLKRLPDFDMDELWRHSILTGEMCALLARKCRGRLGLAPDEFYVVGLLHDMGKIVLVDNLGEQYLEVVRQSKRTKTPIYVCENRTLGTDHTVIGEIVARRWSLPDIVCRAIRFHHGPLEEVAKNPIVALVGNVNLMTQHVAERNLQAAYEVFDQPTCRALGVRYDDCREMVAKAIELLPGIAV